MPTPQEFHKLRSYKLSGVTAYLPPFMRGARRRAVGGIYGVSSIEKLDIAGSIHNRSTLGVEI